MIRVGGTRCCLGQRGEKILHPIYYVINSLNVTQNNYIVIELELFVVVFALEKFQSHFLRTKVIVHIKSGSGTGTYRFPVRYVPVWFGTGSVPISTC